MMQGRVKKKNQSHHTRQNAYRGERSPLSPLVLILSWTKATLPHEPKKIGPPLLLFHFRGAMCFSIIDLFAFKQEYWWSSTRL
jgi:hypothetical protein